MIYLDVDFDGGQTNFEFATVEPQAGLALFFIHHLPHEGVVVLSGREYVPRNDVMYAG